MAINIPIITEFADQGLKSAQGAFATFRQKVGEAEGGMGKFKAAGGVAMDSIKANAGAMALGAGAAIAGFAAKAIGDFKDLALSVDEFRNTTGLTLDQSSQWVSYTGDLGIQAESMVKIFNRLGKAATDQLPAFKELGVEIAFGPDGAADLEKTFLRVNDAINSLDDPVAQAKYRADLFGRGWMDAAELINMSSDEITTALAGVKDFEVIDEDEIKKAKDLRQAQDELGDAFARISVQLGQALIPAFTALLNAATPLLDLLGKIDTQAMQSAGSRGALPLLSEKLDELGLSSLTAGTIIGELNKLFGDNE
ncbi:MAG TPA: phage tail tape measure protein, partial [Acidimicrobiia bacterium]